nr:2656_t:CDS:2 [Entrophospora candida]
MKNKENCTIEIIEDNIIDEDDKGIEIIDDPKKWSQKKKLIILILLCFLNMIGPLANSVLYPALLNILADLRIDNETYVNALIGIFMVFWGVSPIFWASYSDMRSTRRNVFLIALLLLLISSIICAISNSIELLLAMRALQACGSSVAQSVGAGCISDLYIPSERGKHYGVFYIGFFVGVLIGPIVGGSIALNFGWSFNPFVAFKLLKSKNASLAMLYCSLSAIAIYVQHIIVPRILIIDYGFNSFDVGLIYVIPGSGFVIGCFAGGKWSDVVYNRLTKKNNNVSYPELRIHSGWAVSLSTQLILSPQETYLVDSYPESSASIVALNKLFAFISAGVMSVLILPMANALGIGWSLTILASFNVFSIGLLIIICLKGKEWRENYQIS